MELKIMIRFKFILIGVLLSLGVSGQNFFWSHSGEKACFGYLYNYYAFKDARNITSSDSWAVPSFSQANPIFGNNGTDAAPFKSTSSLVWNTPGTDTLGLSIPGSGVRLSSGSFSGILATATIWVNNDYPGTRDIDISSTINNSLGANRAQGATVRLVSDATGIPNGATTTYTGNDGKVYNAIAIDELYWMTENLEETKYRNGDYIQGFGSGVYTPISNAVWAALTTGALCLYNDDLSYQCK